MILTESAPADPLRPERGEGRLECLDALRGIAALAVYVQHFSLMFPKPTEGFVPTALYRIESFSGSSAVDLFFVLSGFVLTLPYVGLRAKRVDYADFIVRRMTRLYPAYWIAVAAALAARLAIGDRVHASALTEWTASYWSAPLTQNEILRNLSMILPFDGDALNSVFWSLRVEMQVSLILPFFIALVAITSGPRGAVLILVCSALIGFVIADHTGLQFLPLFALGVVLARFRSGLVEFLEKLSPLTWVALLALSLLLLEARAFMWRFPQFPSDSLPGAGAGLLIVALLARPQFSRTLVNPVTGLLGTTSYSLYLLHVPVILATVPLIYSYTRNVWIAMAAGVFICVGLAQGVYRFVEMPCQAAGRRLAKRVAVWTNVGQAAGR